MKFRDYISAALKPAAVALTVAVCTGCSSVIEHPEFAQRRAGIRRIAVVTPNIEFHCQAPKSRQALPDAEAKLRAELIAAMTRELTGKGFAVEFPAWQSFAKATNDECTSLAMQETVDRAGARTNFYTFIRWRDPKERATPEQKADAQSLAKLAAADTIAFVQLHGYTNTLTEQGSVGARNVFLFLGAVAGGAAGGVPIAGNGNFEPLYGVVSVQFMLVEGATGEPLWANAATSTDEHPKVEKLVKELLEPLPKVSPRNARNFPERGGP